MKTTIDVPDSLLLRAKAVALQRGTTLKRLIIEGLEEVMSKRQGELPEELTDEERTFMRVDALGVPVLARRPEDEGSVSEADVDRLREELGI